MAGSVVLKPVAQSYGRSDLSIIGTAIWDTPTLVGGGDLGDDSDASYLAEGAFLDTNNSWHVEPISCDFVLPAPYTNPTALLFQVRMKNDADVLASTPTGGTQVWQTVRSVADGTEFSHYSSASPAVDPILLAQTTTPTWFTWWWGDPVDINVAPTTAWFRFSYDEDHAGTAAALTGSGLRCTFGFFWNGEPGNATRRVWVDMYEFRLVVYCDGAPAGRVAPYLAPRRLHPREDAQGLGGARLWPPPRSGRLFGGYL